MFRGVAAFSLSLLRPTRGRTRVCGVHTRSCETTSPSRVGQVSDVACFLPFFCRRLSRDGKKKQGRRCCRAGDEQDDRRERHVCLQSPPVVALQAVVPRAMPTLTGTGYIHHFPQPPQAKHDEFRPFHRDQPPGCPPRQGASRPCRFVHRPLPAAKAWSVLRHSPLSLQPVPFFFFG